LRLEVLAVGGERRRERMARILSQAREESVGCLDRFPLSSNYSATRAEEDRDSISISAVFAVTNQILD
jgi:hypothetical protein